MKNSIYCCLSLFFFFACKPKNEYSIKAEPIDKIEHLPYVSRINVSAPNFSPFQCTQVFILPHVSLTTAQCVFSAKAVIKQNNSPIAPSRKIVHPLFDPTVSSTFIFNIAILIYPFDMQSPYVGILNLPMTEGYDKLANGLMSDGFIVSGLSPEVGVFDYPKINLIYETEGIIDLEIGKENHLQFRKNLNSINLIREHRGLQGGVLLEFSQERSEYFLRGVASNVTVYEMGGIFDSSEFKQSAFLDVSSPINRGFLSEQLATEPNLAGVCCRCQSDLMHQLIRDDIPISSRKLMLEKEYSWKKVKEGPMFAKYFFANKYENSCSHFDKTRFYVESEDRNFDSKIARREQFYEMKKCFEIERGKCD